MRVTIAHKKTKAEVKDTVDRTFDKMFEGAGGMPVQVEVQQKGWNGDVLTFAVIAKMAFMSTPIKGTVEVTERDVTVDADLGILGNLVGGKKAQEIVEKQVRGFLN